MNSHEEKFLEFITIIALLQTVHLSSSIVCSFVTGKVSSISYSQIGQVPFREPSYKQVGSSITVYSN